MDKDELIRF